MTTQSRFDLRKNVYVPRIIQRTYTGVLILSAWRVCSAAAMFSCYVPRSGPVCDRVGAAACSSVLVPHLVTRNADPCVCGMNGSSVTSRAQLCGRNRARPSSVYNSTPTTGAGSDSTGGMEDCEDSGSWRTWENPEDYLVERIGIQ